MHNIAITLFVTGVFLGLGPCLVSCGPILISYIAASGKGYRQSLAAWFIFSSARIFIYCLLGGIAAIFGELFLRRTYSAYIAKYISITGGIFIIIIGITMLLGNRQNLRICSFLDKYFIKKDFKSVFIFGMIVAIVPCAPLIGIFSSIGLMSRSIAEGMLFSLFFGLGTLFSPLLFLAVAAGFIGQFLKDAKPRAILNNICAIIITILGIFIIFRNYG